ncbi:monocarboxylate transporter 2-like [Liolophura sinensis]|uniref:monocarboxylate transporter 2-like n=1 Tax=Liolophura sinensis TaxID=3198878 RepID=UPI003157FA06
MMSLPPLVMYLIHEYGLQGSFLIYGGLLLNCAVGAAVVRPIKGAYSEAAGPESIETGKSKRACTEAPSVVQKFQAAGKSEGISEYQSLFKDKKCRSPDISHLPNSLPESSMLSAEVYEQKLSNTQTNSNNAIDDEQMFERAHSSAQTRHTSMPSSSKMAKEWLQSKRQPNRNINTVTNSLEEPDFENSHRRWCSSYASLHCVDGSMYLFTDRECPMAEDLSFQRGPESLSSTKPSICDFIRSIFDFSLFRHVRFMLFLFSTSFAMVSFANVTIYLIPRAEEYGIGRDKAALFLTIAGGCDIIGRLILGVVSDVKKIGPHRVMMVGLLVMGIATLLLPLAVTFNTMTVYVVLFGLIGSSGHLLCLPVVMMFVGGERMPRAMGLVMSFHGIASALSPPILGFIKDQTGTYDSTLYVCGACQLIASGLMMLEPLVGWIRSRYKS